MLKLITCFYLNWVNSEIGKLGAFHEWRCINMRTDGSGWCRFFYQLPRPHSKAMQSTLNSEIILTTGRYQWATTLASIVLCERVRLRMQLVETLVSGAVLGK